MFYSYEQGFIRLATDYRAAEKLCMNDDKMKAAEAIRKQVNSVLRALSPTEAKALRIRFGIAWDGAYSEEEVEPPRALARELA